jgi:hypothetical protein
VGQRFETPELHQVEAEALNVTGRQAFCAALKAKRLDHSEGGGVSAARSHWVCGPGWGGAHHAHPEDRKDAPEPR